MVNAVFAIVDPTVIPRLWREIDLSHLVQRDPGQFFVVTFLLSITSLAKAWLFYQVITILHNNDLDLSQPFSKKLRRFIFRLSYAALVIGLFSLYGIKYAEWLMTQGIKMPDTQHMGLGGADVWLFMAIVLYIIAHIFNRGIEIQSENDLTI
jgi:hypothetical protein